MNGQRDSLSAHRLRRRRAAIARLAIAGAFLLIAARSSANDKEIDDILARQGFARADLLLDSEAILAAAFSDDADLAVERLRAATPAKSLLESEVFRALAPAARDRARWAIATARLGRDETQVAAGTGANALADEREILAAIAATEPEAPVAVMGCRSPMRVPLFDFQRAARERLVELNDSEQRQLLASADGAPAMVAIALVSAEVSPEFRESAMRAALAAGATSADVASAYETRAAVANVDPGAARAIMGAFASLEMKEQASALIRSAEQPARDAALAALRERIASDWMTGGAWGVQMASELTRLAEETPAAAGAIYAALPREYAVGRESALLGALSSAALGAEAARALASTRDDLVAERMENAATSAFASTEAGRLATARNAILGLRLMRTPRADTALESIAAAEIAEGPDADKLVKLRRKATSSI